MSDESDLLGVYELTDDFLLLRGIVSTSGGASSTELVYNPAVKVLAFPMQSGTSFSTDTNVNGLMGGVTVNYTEHHESLVDSRGTIITPHGTLQILRIRVLMTRTIGTIVTTVRSYTFIDEDHGIVGYIKSQDNESSGEFTDFAEIWRLGL